MKNVSKKSSSESLETLDSNLETLDSNSDSGVVVEPGSVVSESVAAPAPLTAEQIAEREALLRAGIAQAVEWFEAAQSLEAEELEALGAEQLAYRKLLDPVIWLMREALVSYEHLDCEECTLRRSDAGSNSLALALAGMVTGV